MAPAWQPPKEKAITQTDPWVKRWGIIAAVCVALMVLMFAGYWFGLSSVVSQLHTLAGQGKG